MNVKKTKLRKGLSVLLSLCMVLAMFPMSAMAAGQDYTALEAAISDAQAAKADVVTSTDGADVAIGTEWVTEAVMTALDDAIAAAQDMVTNDTAANESEVTTAISTLGTAVTTFETAKADGTFITPSIETISFDPDGGGIGKTCVISSENTSAGQYLVIQITEGTGAAAKVSVVMVKAEDSVTVSYKTTAHIQAWITDGMPKLSGSEATGVTIYSMLSTAAAEG